MKCLALFLRGPMQSWGVFGKFGERPTLSHPSKSGLIGMLAAASGIDRTDDAWLARAAGLSLSVRTYHVGPCLLDFHTVGGGYDRSTWAGRRSIPVKAEDGKPGTTALTRREYLQDAAFGIVLSGDDSSLVEQLAESLRDPVWGVWLGRKSCIPTEPVLVGVSDGMTGAWDMVEARVRRIRGECIAVHEEVSECGISEADDLLPDVPLSFASRRFGVRSVSYTCGEATQGIR